MTQKTTAKTQIQKILDTHGGKTADEAISQLQRDPFLKAQKPALEFISKNWRDPLRPALISLACESVGGKPTETEEVAVAMSLMNLSFYLWDDIIDQTPNRMFKSTMFGKFGEASTLIMGGLTSAKAFTILNNAKLDQTKRETVLEMFWNMWTRMAEAETLNFQARGKEYLAKDKLAKIKTEAAASLEACLKIGAIVGNGSENEIGYLGKYGLHIGVILELQHDIQVSLNLTLELGNKIKTGALPYTLLWAKEHNSALKKKLQELISRKTVEPKEIDLIIKEILAVKAHDKIEKTIKKLTKQAVKELEQIEKNSATRALQVFAEVQPQAFREIL